MSGIRSKIKVENLVLFVFGLICLINLIYAQLKGFSLPYLFYFNCIAWIILRLAQSFKWFRITGPLFFVLILASLKITTLSPVYDFFFHIGIFPQFLLIPLILTLILLFGRWKEIKSAWLKIQGRSPEQKAQQRLSSQEQFKQKFKNLTEEQLMAKLDQNLQPGAQDAIHELLKEKKEG